MARDVWNGGFEAQMAGITIELATDYTPVASSAKVRGPYTAYSCLLMDSANSGATTEIVWPMKTAVSEWYDRDCLYMDSVSSTRNTRPSNLRLCRSHDTFTGTNYQMWVQVNATSGLLELWVYNGAASTLLATGSTIIPFDAWNVIELHGLISATVGVGVVRLNGSDEISFSGDTKKSSRATTVAYKAASCVTGATTCPKVYLDDCARNDTTGSTQNSWCGELEVEAMVRPSSDVSTAWTPSGAGGNYAQVNENPPTSATYNLTNTTNATDVYGKTSLPADITSITHVGGWHLSQSVGSPTPTKVVVGVQVSGTDYVGSGDTVNGTDTFYEDQIDTDPSTGSAWTVSGLEAANIVLKALA